MSVLRRAGAPEDGGAIDPIDGVHNGWLFQQMLTSLMQGKKVRGLINSNRIKTVRIPMALS